MVTNYGCKAVAIAGTAIPLTRIYFRSRIRTWPRHLRALKCISPFLFIDDYNRVVLETIEGESDSDYVNASYVDVSISRYSIISMRVLILEKTN